jgi:hypothetical protein
MSRSDPARDDLTAALAARQELGKEYEPALVESFLDRIEERAEQRVRESSAAYVRAKPQQPVQSQDNQLALGVWSLGFGIPISGIAAGVPGNDAGKIAGLMVVWAGIGLVNWAYAWSRRHLQG